MILWTGCIDAWFRHLTHYQIDPRIWTDCRLYYFLLYFGKHYSSMLLVLMSLEKCFAVYFPLKSKTICTVKTAKWATGIVATILVASNSVNLVDRESRFSKSYGHRICILKGDYILVVDSVLYSFGPFILMFITNFAIAFKFMRARCNQSNSTESTNQALLKSATRGTVMVVTVSVTFLILTAPSAVSSALWYVIQLPENPIYRVFMNITQYLNHGINGVLYCIVGSRFRKELIRIFCRKARNERNSIPNSTSNTSVSTISERTS